MYHCSRFPCGDLYFIFDLASADAENEEVFVNTHHAISFALALRFGAFGGSIANFFDFWSFEV